MQPMIEFINGLITKIIAKPTMTRGDAVTELRLVTNGVSNVEGGAWFDDIATFYNSIGCINTPTFNSWRNGIIRDGEAVSQAMIAATGHALIAIVTLGEVNQAIRLKERQDRIVTIATDIANVRTFRDSQTDPAVVKALNIGIKDMLSQREGLKQRIGGL